MKQEELLKFNSLDIILICGLPGSGKSHFAEKYFRHSGFKRINRIEIRKHLYSMFNFGDPWKEVYFDEESEHLVKHVERKLLEHLLFTHQKVLIDNTSVTKPSRKSYVSTAIRYKKSIGVVYLATSAQICMQRNKDRGSDLPEEVISHLYALREEPDFSEGFKEILILESY